MGVCVVCGNDYDKSFEILYEGESQTFDCFECAIHRLAPACEHCGVKIVGHGMEAAGHFYCCDHCATAENVSGLRDRTPAATK